MRNQICLIVAAAATLAQDLPGTVSGKVTNIVGEPVFGVSMDGVDMTSNADGSFRIVRLRPGSHQLLVRSPGYKFEYLDFELESGQDLVLPRIEVAVANAGCPDKPHPQRTLLRQNSDLGDLAGDVFAGEAPLLAEIALQGASESRTTATDVKGRYRFVGLKPGLYTVTARRRGFYEEQETFKVEAGFESRYSGDLRLTLCLDGACRLPRPPVVFQCE